MYTSKRDDLNSRGWLNEAVRWTGRGGAGGGREWAQVSQENPTHPIPGSVGGALETSGLSQALPQTSWVVLSSPHLLSLSLPLFQMTTLLDQMKSSQSVSLYHGWDDNAALKTPKFQSGNPNLFSSFDYLTHIKKSVSLLRDVPASP